MNTEQIYRNPAESCLGHLQATIAGQTMMLNHYINYIGDDLYSNKELKTKLLQVVSNMSKAEQDTQTIMDKHYARKTKENQI